MSKVKIKKDKKSLSTLWHEATLASRMIIVFPIVAVVVLAGLIGIWSTGILAVNADETQAKRELLLSTDGVWDTVKGEGLQVWCPSDMSKDDAHGEGQLLYTTRDKGGYPEITYGVMVAQDIEDRIVDLSSDPGGALDIITPMITEAFGTMINGAYPTITADIDTYTAESGETVLRGRGDATVVLVYQDPKDAENQWSEETTLNLYYNATMFRGELVVVWGTWDASTYEGEETVTAEVTDGIISLMHVEEKEENAASSASSVDVPSAAESSISDSSTGSSSSVASSAS